MMALYEQVVTVAEHYLGKKAEAFLERQCRLHVGVDLHNLKIEHLDKLAWWCYMSGSLMMEKDNATQFQSAIAALKAKAASIKN